MRVYNNLRTLIAFAREIGRDLALVQGGGGNCSVKDENGLMQVKASGVRFADLRGHGFVTIDVTAFREAFIREEGVNREREEHEAVMNRMLIDARRSNGRPSMETAMHCFLPRYVLHIHAVSVNVFLCMETGAKILAALFHDVTIRIIPYVSPGYALGTVIAKAEPADIYFLQNHGMIICGETVARLKELLVLAIERCMHYLTVRLPHFAPFDHAWLTKNHTPVLRGHSFLFPDAAVYSEREQSEAARETLGAQRYIEETIEALGDIPRAISKEEVAYLIAMEAEKYRQKKI